MVRTSRLLFRKIVREIRQNWAQFLATIIIAFLAVTLFTGLTSSYMTLESRLNLLYEESNMYDILIDSGTQEITTEIYEDIASNDKVDTIERRLSIYGKVDNQIMTIIVTDDIPNIAKPYVDNLSKGVYIDSYYADSLGVKKGDKIDVSVSTDYGYLINGAEMIVENLAETLEFSIEISEVMLHPESTQQGSMVTGLLWVDYETFHNYSKAKLDEQSGADNTFLKQQIDNIFMYNQIVIRSNNIDELCEELENIYDYSVFERNDLSSHQAVDNDILQGEQLTYVFPVIFFLVAVLVILTTTSQLIIREKTIIGTMKAIGVTQNKILFHYAGFPIVLVLIGGTLGMFVGPALIPYVMAAKYDLLYCLPSSPNVFPWAYSLITIGVMVVLALIVGMVACKNEVRLNPVQSMRGVNDNTFKYREKALSNRFKWHVKIAFRNIFRKKARSIMVIVGLLGCTALFVTGFGIDDTIDHSIDQEIDHNFVYDIGVTYNPLRINPKEAIEDLGVYIEEYEKENVKVVYETMKDTNLYIISENSEIFGHRFPENGVMVSKKIAEMTGMSVGDTITVKLENQTYNFKVGEIFESALTQGVFLRENNDSIPYSPTNAWVKTDKNLVDVTKQINSIEGVTSAYSIDDFCASVDDVVGGIRIITITLKVFACLLAVVVLYNLAHLNYKERSRDIATLKVLGFYNHEIQKSLVIEMMFLTTLGSFLGLFFGYPILQLLLSINENEIVTFIYDIRIESYIYSFIFSLVTSIVVNTLLGRKIKSIKMVESLKSVE